MGTQIKMMAILAISAAILASAQAQAQQFNVGLTAGLTGTNLEVSTPLNDKVTLRAVTYLTGYASKTIVVDANSYGLEFTPKTHSLLIDVPTFGGDFYATGGLVLQEIGFKLTGKTSGGTYTFNETSYTASSVGSISGAAGFGDIAPYLGIGWSNRNKAGSGVAFSAEAGLIILGKGSASLAVACGSALSASQCSAMQADVTAEAAKIKTKLNGSHYYPVVKLGISYRF